MLKQGSLVELRARVALRKQQIAAKRARVAALQNDLGDIKDQFQRKRQRDFDAYYARFNAYADKLSREIKMDQDNL